jgi:hypothetical protein
MINETYNATVKFVANVFTVIGQRITRTCTADLLIDLPSAVESLSNGNIVKVFPRKTGNDTWTRYEVCARSELQREPTEKEVYSYMNRVLRPYTEFWLYPDFHVECRIFNHESPYYRIDERGLWHINKSLKAVSEELIFSSRELKDCIELLNSNLYRIPTKEF